MEMNLNEELYQRGKIRSTNIVFVPVSEKLGVCPFSKAVFTKTADKNIVHSAVCECQQQEAAQHLFHNKGVTQDAQSPPQSLSHLPPTPPHTHTNLQTKTEPVTDALPFGDEGRCVQAPPLFLRFMGCSRDLSAM